MSTKAEELRILAQEIKNETEVGANTAERVGTAFEQAANGLAELSQNVGGVYAKIKAIEDAGYIFAGVATPATNPGTPDGPVFYFASESGTYTNFNAIELQDGLSVLSWNGSWSSQQILSIDDEPTAGSDNLVKSGGVYSAIAKINTLSIFDELSELEGKTDEQKAVMIPNGNATKQICVLLHGEVLNDWTWRSPTGFVRNTGVFVANNSRHTSNPTKVYKGDIITVVDAVSGVAIISETDSEASSYTPLVVSTSTEEITYTYVADREMYIAVSGLNTNTCSITRKGDFAERDDIFDSLSELDSKSKIDKMSMIPSANIIEHMTKRDVVGMANFDYYDLSSRFTTWTSHFINPTTGAATSNTHYIASNYVDITDIIALGMTMRLSVIDTDSGAANIGIAYYNELQQYISGVAYLHGQRTIRLAELTITPPSNATYMRVTFVPNQTFYCYGENIYTKTIKGIEGSITEQKKDVFVRKFGFGGIELNLSDFVASGLTMDASIAAMLSYSANYSYRILHFDVANVTISQTILLPSNTLMLLENCTIKQADEMWDNVIRSANIVWPQDTHDIPSSVERMENIAVIGDGNSKIEGCDVNATVDGQTAIGDDFGARTIQILMGNVDGVEIANLAFTKTRCWCISFEITQHIYCHHLDIRSSVVNGDGIDFRCGCKHTLVEDIYAQTYDDAVAYTLGSSAFVYSATAYPMEATRRLWQAMYDDDNTSLMVEDCRLSRLVYFYYAPRGNVVRYLAVAENHMKDMSINDLKVILGTSNSHDVVKIGDSVYSSTQADSESHIRINNVDSYGVYAIIGAYKGLKDVALNNARQHRMAGVLVRGDQSSIVVVTNSVVE